MQRPIRTSPVADPDPPLDRWQAHPARRSATLVHHTDRAHSDLARHVRAGSMVRVARGWYSISALPSEAAWETRRRIARDRVLALADTLGGDLVVSGLHAALILGAAVSTFPPAVEVFGSVPASTTRGATHIRRRVRTLDVDDICVVEGVRVTSPVRTAVEVARAADPLTGLVVADSLMNLGFDDRADFDDPGPGDRAIVAFRADAAAIFEREPRLRGNSTARVVLEYADGRAQTPIESRARHACLVTGLPRPQLQVPIETTFGRFFPDITFEVDDDSGGRVVHVETDGEVKYQNGADRDAERRREAGIRQLGHGFARLSSRQIYRDCGRAVRELVLPEFPRSVLEHLAPVQGLDVIEWRRRTARG